MPDSIEDSELHRIVQRVVGTLMSERQRPAPEPPAQMEGRRQVALGADHGGFELKGILKTELGTLAVIPQDAALASLIDHTLLKPDATQQEIAQLCFEARKYGFTSVCVNPTWVKLCAELLKGSEVKVCTVIGFPLGATASETKAFETETAINQGAREIDMVANIGALKGRNLPTVANDIRGVVNLAHRLGAIVKVIIEAVLLDDEEKTLVCLIAKEAGADFVKTSTGFAAGGATVHDVQLMRKVVGPKMGVKAAGGIRTFEDAESMIKAGATRIGASAGVKIIQGPARPAAAEKPATASSTKNY